MNTSHRILACASLLFGMALLIPKGAEANAQPTPDQKPFVVDTPWVHDPVMAYEDGTYYIYCTGHDIGMMTSKDRKSWTVHPKGVLREVPAWTHDSVPSPEFQHHIWAPDVFKYKNKWYMAYSCSTFGKNTSAIGLLSNTSLANVDGWEDEGCLVASKRNRDNWNAIDPNFVVDEKGRPWLTWGSFWDGIQLIQLDSKTLHVKKGAKPQTIARRYSRNEINILPNPTSDEAGRNSIEAPFIMKHDGYYYLFVSWDYCCQGMKSTYRVAVGRSKKLAGPYIDHTGKRMLDGGGKLLIEGDKVEYEAIGHCAAYHIDGEDVYISHGYYIPKEGAPILVQRRIVWDKEGWPTLQ